jgi:hypothetical protein
MIKFLKIDFFVIRNPIFGKNRISKKSFDEEVEWATFFPCPPASLKSSVDFHI